MSSKKRKSDDKSDVRTSQDNSIEKKLIAAEKSIHTLQTLTSEMIFKTLGEDQSLTSLVDPLVNLEVALLRKRLLDMKETLAFSEEGRKIKLKNGDILQILQHENDNLKKVASDAAIQKYSFQIEANNKKINELTQALAEAQAWNDKIEQENEQLRTENLFLKQKLK
jgi:hypothetical protein